MINAMAINEFHVGLGIVLSLGIYWLLRHGWHDRQAKIKQTIELTKFNTQLQLELSERQRTEAELYDLYNHAPCGYHSLDAQGTFIRINDTELNWLGYSREEVIGKKRFIDLLTPAGIAVFQENFAQFQQQGRVNNLEFELLCKTGSRLWVNLSATAVKDAAGCYVMSRSTLFNISERKVMEEALRNSEERFRSAFEHASIGMALLELDGQWLQVNTALCQILGYSEAELLSTTVRTLTHPDDFSADRVHWQQLSQGELATYAMQQRYFHKQGHLVWVSLNYSLIRDPVGQPLYLIAQIQDVTTRREIEQIKTEFMALVSHELRTPLTAIRGSLGLLTSGALRNCPERAQRMIEIASIDTERLVQLVNDILDLERLESGQVSLTKQPCNVFDLITRSLNLVQAEANKTAITIVTMPTTAQVWASPAHIVQVLTNLLDNAIKFSPPGSRVTVTAETIPAEPAYVLLRVQDQGGGIPSNQLELIFERFQQADTSDSRSVGGTGLGLAICRRIIQQHWGNIWAESNGDRGSTFCFTLPTPIALADCN